MLEWIWFSGLVFAGLACAIRGAVLQRQARDDFSDMTFAFASFAAMAMALVVSQDRTVLPMYVWLCMALPEPGQQINQLTGIVLTAVACGAFALVTPIAVMTVSLRCLESRIDA